MGLRIVTIVVLLALPLAVGGGRAARTDDTFRPGQALDQAPQPAPDDRPHGSDVEAPPVGAGTSKGLWPDAIVYYEFADDISEFTKGQFDEAFRAWETGTPLRFIERTNEPNYLEIVYSEITSSGVGTDGGRHLLFITPYSHTPLGTVLHELGHAIGLQHEHQRSDRDEYVEVFPENVMPANVTQISLVLNTVNYTPYDFLSIMHYGRKTLSANSGDTIRPREEYIEYLGQIGQRDSLSALDREGVRKMYSFMPLPLSPESDSWTYGSRLLRFTWSGFPDAQFYHIQLASDSSFSQLVHEAYIDPVDLERLAIEPQGTSWAPPNEDGTLYWRVRCQISGRYRAWSDVSQLHVRARDYRTVVRAPYPNPSSTQTTIPFDLEEAGHVRLSIASIDGREVAVLVDDDLPAGEQSVTWNIGGNPSGTYIALLEAGVSTSSRTLTVVRSKE